MYGLAGHYRKNGGTGKTRVKHYNRAAIVVCSYKNEFGRLLLLAIIVVKLRYRIVDLPILRDVFLLSPLGLLCGFVIIQLTLTKMRLLFFCLYFSFAFRGTPALFYMEV